MDYNPLTAKLRAVERAIKTLQRQRRDAESELERAANFSVEAAQAEIERLQSDLAACSQERDGLAADHGRLKAIEDQLKAKAGSLEDKARLGWDPTYWLSDKRAKAKERLKKHRKKVANQIEKVETAAKKLDSKSRDVKRLKATLSRKQRELDQHLNFEPDDVRALIDKIDEEMPFREMERDDLRERKAEVDRRLKAPLAEIRKYEAQVEELHEKVSGLEHEQSTWRRQVAEAERIDAELSRASNSYERAMLHQKCEEQFGKGSPSAVVRDARFQIRRIQSSLDYNERQINRVQRDIEKTQNRIKKLAEAAARDVRALVIDGKNCCFEGNQFIGLAALLPLTRALAQRYDVTVVFDASIRRDLGANDDALRAALPSAKVHVVASRAKADETLLDAASDPSVWVISNDRFGDYRDKPPVRDRRIIRHEILHGRVLVHDLGVDAQFAGKPPGSR